MKRDGSKKHLKKKHRFKKNFIPLIYSVYIMAIFFHLAEIYDKESDRYVASNV